MRLTAIVPATDDPPTLGRCLEAIACAELPPDEVIAVREPPLAGPAQARNDGAALATGDVLVFVDSDVVVDAGAFRRIRAAFTGSELVAVFGSYDDRVETDGLVSGFRNLLHHIVHQRSAGDVQSFWGGLGAVRADVFAAVGGFDAERYPLPAIEDIELGCRLAGEGRILLDPELRGTHLKEWTLASMVRTDFARRGVPWVQLMLERRDLPTTLNLGVRERASALVSLVAVGALLTRRPVVTAVAATAQVGLNPDLYGLLVRRLGLRGAAAGVGLHALHHLAGAAAAPWAVAAAVLAGGDPGAREAHTRSELG